jgi:hypothetical protein
VHALASLIFRRDGLPPQALIDIDTADRYLDWAATETVLAAQGDGRLPAGDRTRTVWLGEQASTLRALVVYTTFAEYCDAVAACREHGSVTFSALRAQLSGSSTPTPPAPPVEVVPPSADEVKRTVRGVITDVRAGASQAESLDGAAVATLEPAEAADLARELWDQLLGGTRLYTALVRRSKDRPTSKSQ